jgi:anti-anti-sigma factor
MEVSVREEPQGLVVAVTGRLDGLTVPEFDRQAAAWVKPGKLLVLDLAQLNYISSAGLRSVLMLSKQMKTSGGRLALCGVTGFIQEVITLSGFHTFLPIHADAASALKST